MKYGREAVLYRIFEVFIESMIADCVCACVPKKDTATQLCSLFLSFQLQLTPSKCCHC